MFDVLMYLFETYIHNEPEMRVDQDQLTDDLAQAGFDRDDIYNALNWLEKLADLQEGENAPYFMDADPLAMRIYTEEEGVRWMPVAVVSSCPGADSGIEPRNP
jgi:Smg protein